MPHPGRSLLAATLVGAAESLAGCGSSDRSDSTPPPPRATSTRVAPADTINQVLADVTGPGSERTLCR